jgi:hypothetical protein
MPAYIVVNATITDRALLDESPEYQAVIGKRLNSTNGFLTLVDGFA